MSGIYNNVMIAAEVGQAHDGDIDVLHAYIDALALTGVDVVKFQTHIAEAESSAYEPFRVKMATSDKTRYDYWKRMEFSKAQWKAVKKHCDDVGLEFMSSPFSNAAVDLLEEVGVKRYKIGSGEVSNFLLLERIAQTGKPMIVSSGMSRWEELDETIAFLKSFSVSLTILQCTSRYPTPAEEVGLNVIPQLKERYGLPVGISDHSGTIYPSLAAVPLGVQFIEVHAVLDKTNPGPDTTSSLTIPQLEQLVEGVRFIERSLEYEVDKENNEAFRKIKDIFEKSLSVNKDLKPGSRLSFADLEGKKPFGYGIPAKDFREVIGAQLRVPKKRHEFLKTEDLEL